MHGYQDFYLTRASTTSIKNLAVIIRAVALISSGVAMPLVAIIHR